MKLTIKQKQAIYEHLLTLDCPDLLAALIAERSDTLITKINTLAECIQLFAWWRNTTETRTFWEHIYDEVLGMEKGFESPTDRCFTGAPEDVVYYKSEPLVIAPVIVVDVANTHSARQLEEHYQESNLKDLSLWTKVKLFFGKLFYGA